MKTNFWSEFKWKWLFITFLFLFLFTLIFEILFNLNNWLQFFAWKNLLRRFVLAAIISFITRVWQENYERKKRNQKTS
ncbi:MAG TPA: hypothetical protein VMY77_14060 [Chitinophagaceae bacterium]|nr:hypothetical protein [Chitinophagaceae bacterium]